ncbi:MAG: adenosylmethionine--8-amino-7-oxononanoate transaminase [Candidatus Hydrogenedentes bacterium]|nr:adenosylmethionine--8-amino-7-oxononanoate transaminase [Candidatus Hydrogenedentota bacterium]
MNLAALRQVDNRHLWHPYTDAVTFEQEPYTCIERAEGVYLYTADGRKLYDGIASWWAVSFGHSHPKIISAVREQAGVLQHCILGNMSHPKAVELAQRLAYITPGDLNYSYFACDGSSATEAALKMAVQYWAFNGRPEKTQFVGLEEGYHGDTLGAIGAGYVSWFHEPYAALVKPALRAPSPFAPCNSGEPEEEAAADRAFDEMERIVRENQDTIAAVIVEPLCQGAAGIHIYPKSYLQRLRVLCDACDVLLIADEIAVGFARTGSMFACEEAGIVPDIMCLGKALTAGYLPMSVAVASDRVFGAFRRPDAAARIFFDGHTYCGNPITSAAALATLDLMEELGVPASCAPRYAQLAEGMRRIGALPGVRFQKSLGLIGMCEMAAAPLARRASLKANELGLFIRPLGASLYLWPPLTSTEAELGAMIELLEQAIRAA